MKNRIFIFILYFLVVCNPFVAYSLVGELKTPPIKKGLDSLINSAENKLIEAENLAGLANYPKAYDHLWSVLSLADSIHSAQLKYKAYKQLTMLYSIFHKYDKAATCVDSMFFYAKKTTRISSKTKGDLHFTAAITYRMNQKYKEASEQLNSCERILDSLGTPLAEKLYLLTEKAHLNTLAGNYKESETILRKITEQVSPNHSYISIIYSMWGDLYLKMDNKQQALNYFTKSLEAVTAQNIRLSLKVELLSKASKINNSLGNYKVAFQQMEASKKLGDSLFGSQSILNKQLFEIKDSYREVIVENQRIQKEQELKLLKSKKDTLNQQLIFSVILLVIIIIASIVIFSFLKKRHILEKELITERTRSAIEIKKKELTLTALQLLEKDKLLDEIKTDLEKIQQDESSAAINKITSTINVNSKKNWDEFEARFVQINTTFYDSLHKKHSDLSGNELKLCALIKLNFSSKEMAQILGVSPESINKARYRLRKKLNLERDENLVTYINSI